jgi:outer membrane protein assembly complex protein YaeT
MKAMDRFHRPLRRLLLVLAVVLAGAVAACYAQAPAKLLVADVLVPGEFQLPKSKIYSLIKTRPGAEYNQSTVDDDVRALWDTHSFAMVQAKKTDPVDGKVTVYFLLTPLTSTVQEIIYEGAKHLSNDDLEAVTGLHKGQSLSPITNLSACHKIEQKYEEKARMFARVELLEGGKQGDTRVHFLITEGPKIKVRHTHFTGNHFVSEGRLRTQIDTSRAFLGLLGGDYNPAMADHDVAQLEKYYKSFGYQDVVVSRELVWSEDYRSVDIIFHVNEGLRYRLAGIDISGNRSVDQDKMLTLIPAKPGDYYNQSLIAAGATNMKDYVGYTGHELMVNEALTWGPTYDDKGKVLLSPGEVQAHYELQERPPATVGQIFIVGNDVTRQNVIQRQIPLFPGQVLTYPDLRRAELNLARLNIFEMNKEKGIEPRVEVLDPESDNPVKDLLVTVQETHTGSLMFGLGVNSDAGLTGSIVLNERNFDITRVPTSWDDLLSGRAFRGAGQEFRIEAVPGTQLQRYTVSWREPFLFDTPNSLGLSGYYYDRQFNEDLESRYGGRITVGRRLNEFWTATGSIRLEGIDISQVAFFEPVDYLEAVGTHFAAGFRAGLTRDTRDSFLRPTSGSLVEMGFEEVTGTNTYPLASIEASKFFTIYQRADGSGKHVLALHSQIAWAGDNTPVYDKYFAGGFRSLRGFAFRGVGPETNGYFTGGDFMLLNSAEYQIPVLANDQLYFVGFIDSGTVEQSVEIRNYRVAAGGGIRIVVPMLGPVPIALDFGYPLVQAAGDQKQLFSFWLGFFH